MKVEPEWFDVLEGRDVYIYIFDLKNICTYPPTQWVFSRNDLSWRVHKTVFQVDFLDVILILAQSLQYSRGVFGWGGCDHPLYI